MTPSLVDFALVAPANAPGEIAALVDAGASEVYCGVLPEAWSQRYGDWDSLSRRQGTIANLRSVEELREMASEARRTAIRCSLALNVRYTSDQIDEVLGLAETWERAGGHAVLVSDVGLLAGLRQRGSGLHRHLSILAGAMNSAAVAFFQHLGVERVVLPRELATDEIADLVRMSPGIEFEAMALNEKCQFADAHCGFYHGRLFSREFASCFAYERDNAGQASVWTHDPEYSGHGCQVPFVTACGKPVRHLHRNDVERPHCAACALSPLWLAGVRLLKIGGRGLPLELKVRSVRYLHRAVHVVNAGGGPPELHSLYTATFGTPCKGQVCYYP